MVAAKCDARAPRAEVDADDAAEDARRARKRAADMATAVEEWQAAAREFDRIELGSL